MASSSLRSVPRTQERYEYEMLSSKDDDADDIIYLVADEPEEPGIEQLEVEEPVVVSWKEQAAIDLAPSQDRETYVGALAFNICAFILPALYATLSKLWVANIDSTMVVTTDSYTYIGILAEILNQGLPRASYLIIGDKSLRSFRERLQLTHTLIFFQSIMGLIMSMAFVAGAATFAEGFVPSEVRAASVTYVRISAFSVFSSAVEYSANAATRALDKPEVPLIISSTKFIINILLDLLLISKFHVTGVTPTVNMQASILLVCNLASALAGLGYFIYTTTFSPQSQLHTDESGQDTGPSLTALITLFKPGAVFFVESIIRNMLYLWIIHNIISMGTTYATAWGIFTTIRWGIIGVPVMAAEATTLTFTGHSWGSLRATLEETGSSEEGEQEEAPAQVSPRQLWAIVRWAFYSIAIILIVEVPLCIIMSAYGTRPFARYLSGSDEVARIALHMWRTIFWCYVLYGMADQLAAILVATRPHWYLCQSLTTNVLYVLPWAIACQVAELDPEHAWTYHGFIFGGSLVFAFFVVIGVDAVWAARLTKGKSGVGK